MFRSSKQCQARWLNDAVWNLLQQENLPRENYRNIQYLFRFLHEVSKLKEKNIMLPGRLAIVITPDVVSTQYFN